MAAGDGSNKTLDMVFGVLIWSILLVCVGLLFFWLVRFILRRIRGAKGGGDDEGVGPDDTIEDARGMPLKTALPADVTGALRALCRRVNEQEAGAAPMTAVV